MLLVVVGLLRIHGAPGVPGLRWLLGVGNQTKVVNAVHPAGEGVAKGGHRATGTGHGAPPPSDLRRFACAACPRLAEAMMIQDAAATPSGNN